MVGSTSSFSGIVLALGVIILLLVKDTNAFSNIQGMKKVENVKDEGEDDEIMVEPTRKDFDAKKEIIGDASRVSDDEVVALQHGRSKLGGRKAMIDSKNLQRKAMDHEVKKSMKNHEQEEASKMTGANFVENAKLEKKLKMQHKLSTSTTTLHHDQKLKDGVFMALNADYGRMARTHPPRNN